MLTLLLRQNFRKTKTASFASGWIRQRRKKFQGKRERQVFITYTRLPAVESRHAAESEEGMSEAMTNHAAMYDRVEAVRNLNSVEGFNPRDFMRVIQGEGESAKYYLDVAFRKLWFRLKYPEGRISKRLLKLENDMAVIEARVYLNYRDAEENFVANAFSHKFRADDSQLGSKFVELAETAATGRALADAGFGLQFADCEKETDPEVADAPFEPRFLQREGAGMSYAAGNVPEIMDEAGTVVDENNLPGQHRMEEYLDASQTAGQTTPAMQQNAATAPSMPVQKPIAAAPSMMQGRTPVQAPHTPQQNVGAIDKRLPVEQIYAMLDRDTAAAVVVNVGYSKGKTLGQIAVEKPESLEWYVNQYNGPDNLLRAASKYLIDSALQKAG